MYNEFNVQGKHLTDWFERFLHIFSMEHYTEKYSKTPGYLWPLYCPYPGEKIVAVRKGRDPLVLND